MTARVTFTSTINTDRIEDDVRGGAVQGLHLGAEHVLTESNREVPIEEGTLLRSGQVDVDAGSLTASVSYDTPYAVRQHEDQTLHHDQGRHAKFLENAMARELDTVAQIVATQLRQAIGG